MLCSVKNRAAFSEPFYSGAKGLLCIYFGEIVKGPRGAQQRNGNKRKNLPLPPMDSILQIIWNEETEKLTWGSGPKFTG